MRNLLFNVSIATAMATMFVVMFWAGLRLVKSNLDDEQRSRLVVQVRG